MKLLCPRGAPERGGRNAAALEEAEEEEEEDGEEEEVGEAYWCPPGRV